ncbi:GNAT family N-acetyltransferase [Paenibacillus sp. FSL M8-0334]|uniref:GNAT family N-acetyltransferase n=1 Tax=Paenibacillus sp. FSL M8-0334 TaxID=2921623 RepID=UPI0030F97508
MKFTIVQLDSLSEQELMNGVTALYQQIFETPKGLIEQLEGNPSWLAHVALDGSSVVGFKLGYALSPNKFYSWLGGVDPKYRKQGVASALMNEQHRMLKDKGYKKVQTKTKNRWRNMLILNLKHGFDVIGTYTDSLGEPKIILEKRL